MNISSEITELITNYSKQAVTLRISIVDNDLRLDLISVHKAKRNKGLGTKVMEDIAKLADRHQKKVHLKPDPFSLNTDRLYRFYERLGYKSSNFRGEMSREINKP